MLERQWRAECASLTRRRRGAARDCPRALQSDRAALGLPRLPRAHHGLAEHPGPELSRACAGAARLPRARSACATRSSRHSPGLLSARGGLEVRLRRCGARLRLVLTWFLIALTFIDLDHQLLPDTLTLPLLWLGLLASLVGGARTARQSIPVDLRSSVIGAVGGLCESCGASISCFGSRPARKAWATGTSSCWRRSAPGSAGRCCCRSCWCRPPWARSSACIMLAHPGARPRHPDRLRALPRRRRLADARCFGPAIVGRYLGLFTVHP